MHVLISAFLIRQLTVTVKFIVQTCCCVCSIVAALFLWRLERSFKISVSFWTLLVKPIEVCPLMQDTKLLSQEDLFLDDSVRYHTPRNKYKSAHLALGVGCIREHRLQPWSYAIRLSLYFCTEFKVTSSEAMKRCRRFWKPSLNRWLSIFAWITSWNWFLSTMNT